MFSRSQPGFTVLEALIVLAVFALFATAGALAINSSRARLRDAQRLSNVSTLRAGLSRFWLEKATYPASAGLDLAKPGAKADVLSASGFMARDEAKDTLYIDAIPAGPSGNEYYHYHGGPNGYSIRFRTESTTDLGKANVFYAHSNGIDGQDAER
jgi:prepilin-type N-terminal cleavage/methylation domain-containing protein